MNIFYIILYPGIFYYPKRKSKWRSKCKTKSLASSNLKQSPDEKFSHILLIYSSIPTLNLHKELFSTYPNEETLHTYSTIHTYSYVFYHSNTKPLKNLLHTHPWSYILPSNIQTQSLVLSSIHTLAYSPILT